MTTRREFLAQTGAAVAGLALASRSKPIIEADDLLYMTGLARATIAAATKNDSKQTIGFPVITPGGDYPSMWVRDLSMAAGCGLIPLSTLRNHVRLIADAQNEQERRLGARAAIPANAIPDHIRYDGKPVFYPGTYSPGDDQGGEPWGVLPPVDDHYEFIHLAFLTWRQARSSQFLEEPRNGMAIYERLILALDCPEIDHEAGLVITRAARRAVGFGFCDGVYFTGHLLFASLLRYRALGEMLELGRTYGTRTQVAEWERQRNMIRAALPRTFQRDGWLIAATDVGRQPDVWGTAFALHLGVLRGLDRRAAQDALLDAYRRGSITHLGAVRHIPTDRDFSPASAWEKTAGIPKNRYQNGAYWHVPTGWLASALWSVDPQAARELVKDMVRHFRDDDFRKGKGAPYECIHPEGNYSQNPVYMASVTLPLEVIAAIR